MEDAPVTSMLLHHPALCPPSAPDTVGKVTKTKPQVSALVQVLCAGSAGAAFLCTEVILPPWSANFYKSLS